MGAYGGIIGVEAGPCFGIEARVSLPAKFNVFSLRIPGARASTRLHYLTFREQEPARHRALFPARLFRRLSRHRDAHEHAQRPESDR